MPNQGAPAESAPRSESQNTSRHRSRRKQVRYVAIATNHSAMKRSGIMPASRPGRPSKKPANKTPPNNRGMICLVKPQVLSSQSLLSSLVNQKTGIDGIERNAADSHHIMLKTVIAKPISAQAAPNSRKSRNQSLNRNRQFPGLGSWQLSSSRASNSSCLCCSDEEQKGHQKPDQKRKGYRPEGPGRAQFQAKNACRHCYG